VENCVTQITQSGNGVDDKRVDFAYDPVGQFESITRYSDLAGTAPVVTTNYAYDEHNRLERLSHSNGTGDMAFYDFAYDAANRITQITNVDGVTDYTYNARNELTGADHSDINNPDEVYDYDANGNRVESHLHGTSYDTGTNNQLTTDGVYTYTYDEEGNMTTQTEIATGNERIFVWDHLNRLIGVVDEDSADTVLQEVAYTYDVMNRRIAKSVDGSTTRFVYDRDDVLLEFEGNIADPSMRYLHGPQVDQVLAQEDGLGATQWLLGDHLGTIKDLVDDSGNLLNHRTFDSYGNLVSETDGSFESRYSFTGREFDAETGLHYYRARYYDGELGRFVSQDPIGFIGGSTNLYRYVKNSPMDRTDPSGLRDTRWPGNGSVTNLSDKPVIILNSNTTADYPEALYPGKSTPDSPGRSKDADGVWVCRNNQWVFYEISVGNIRWERIPLLLNVELPVPENITLGDVTVTNNQVRDRGGRVLSPGLPSNRGRSSSNDLFVGSCDCGSIYTTAQRYPDASVWRPVLPGDSWRGSKLEEILNSLGETRTNISNQILQELRQLGFPF
jgi:RHS repeat-associated protein